MRKFKYTLILPFFFLPVMLMAQVTIGSDIAHNPGAILDLKQDNGKEQNSNRGLGLPRVELQNTDELYPMFTSGDANYTTDQKKAHTGLTVYNTKDDPIERLCPGPYTWEGEKWVRLWGECETNSILCNSSTLLQVITPLGSPINPVSHTIELTLVYGEINLPAGTILNQGGTAVNGLQVQTNASVIGTAPITPIVNVNIIGIPTLAGVFNIPVEITLVNGDKLTCGINIEIIAN